jgi:hypothetical protein
VLPDNTPSSSKDGLIFGWEKFTPNTTANAAIPISIFWLFGTIAIGKGVKKGKKNKVRSQELQLGGLLSPTI